MSKQREKGTWGKAGRPVDLAIQEAPCRRGPGLHNRPGPPERVMNYQKTCVLISSRQELAVESCRGKKQAGVIEIHTGREIKGHLILTTY